LDACIQNEGQKMMTYPSLGLLKRISITSTKDLTLVAYGH
jgi:hypothetical protein